MGQTAGVWQSSVRLGIVYWTSGGCELTLAASGCGSEKTCLGEEGVAG